jgi:transposase
MKKKRHVSREEKIKAVHAYQSGTDSISTLSRIYQQSRQTIYNWVKSYDKKTELERKPGSGRHSKISQADQKKLLKCLKKPASDFGFETDLWNTSRIRILLKKEFKITISKMAIWRTLTAHKLSYKKVQKDYLEADKEKQKVWASDTVNEIKKLVAKHRAILYFEDESNIQLSPTMGKTWAPIGEKIFHKVTSKRGSISAISAISNDGRLVFNLYDNGKRFNSNDIIHFLQQMLEHHPRRHLIVVMDQASCHTSKKVKDFVGETKRLHVFYLPSKSPTYNPDEQVWGHLKNHDLKSHKETSVDGLKKLTRRKLGALKRNKSKLIGIFKRCENHFLYL